MKTPSPTYLTGSRSKKGFALLITITLLAFLVLLLVSLASLTRVETQVANNSQQLSSARQNAMMALNIAIGQLQKEAGPDQRVTARAEILDTASTVLRDTVVTQPLWTGVWKTGSAGLDVVNSGTPQRQTSLGSSSPTVAQKVSSAAWLVSNPTPTTALNPSNYAGTTTGATPNAVELAKRQGANENITVTAPLVEVRATPSGFSAETTIGRYAYWVSDEGLKAKVNLVDPTFASSDPALNQLHHWVPQGTASHLIVPMQSSTTDFRSVTPEILVKTITADSVAFVPSVSPTFKASRVRPDLTTHSRGVLSDVRRGGLKKDLTAAFEDTANFDTFANANGSGLGLLYRTSVDGVPLQSTGGSLSKPDGISWYSLFYHYQAYKSALVSPGAGPGPNGVGNPSGGLPHELSPRGYSITRSGTTLRIGSLLPVAISYRIDVALSSYDADPGPAENWKLRLHYYPQLVLYNPYSVRLALNNFQYERRLDPFQTGADGQLTGTIGSYTIQEAGSNFVEINQAGNAGRLTLRTRAGDLNTLEPGETRVFGLIADKGLNNLRDAITFIDLASSSGMSPDFYQYADLPEFTGTANGDDMVTLAVSNQRQVRMQTNEVLLFPNSIKWPDSLGGARYITTPIIGASNAANSWTPVRIRTLADNPRHILGLFARIKGIASAVGGSGLTYSNINVRPPLFHGNSSSFNVFDQTQTTSSMLEVYLPAFGQAYQDGLSDLALTPSAGGNHFQTTWGDSSTGLSSNSNIRPVLRDVATQPLVSLGQFMHLSAFAFVTTGIYDELSLGTMFVGGSLPSPVVSTSQNNLALGVGTTGGAPNMRLFLDDSYLANEALFDRFFLSTVPPAGSAPSGTTWPAAWTAFNNANSGATLSDATKPFLNARLHPIVTTGAAPALADMRSVDKAARHLLLDGAFNVNSTSVAAWKAFLGGLSGNDLRIFDATAGTTTTVNLGSGSTNKFPFPRFWSASTSATPNTRWSGLRVLDDAQLTELATRIVEQVKLRGPFLSMADFINRRLGPDSALTRAGAIQAAIDTTSPNVNAGIKSNVAVDVTGGIPAVISGNLKDGVGATFDTAIGMPGYLMQQDIIQATSAAMTARSDTFVIRTYGEAVNPATGEVQGKAWAEAVLQRLPDFVDPSLPAETDLSTAPATTAKTTNEIFGRRFQVVGFRWLSPDDL
ncbi:MAG: hypothetical protein H7Y06_00355 [Opitutaceae bacterium]|nr:hypothetical protein [Opitutaceae bacterium]